MPSKTDEKDTRPPVEIGRVYPVYTHERPPNFTLMIFMTMTIIWLMTAYLGK